MLAGRLGHQLLEPQPEAGQRLRDHERELVAPGARERAQRHPQPHAGILRRDGAGAVAESSLPGTWRSLEQLAHADRHQRARDDAKRRESAVAPADIGVAGERPAEGVLGRERFQARAWVGDGDEAVAVVDEREEMREQRQRLDRAAGLGGDDEQGALQVHRTLDRTDPRRVGRVQDVQPRPAVASGERAAQDLRGERGAAHPQQHEVLQFVVVRLGGEQLERAQLREHPLGDRQPAEPVGQLRRARRTPQRRVPAAQPLAHLRLSCERQTVLHLRSQRSR